MVDVLQKEAFETNMDKHLLAAGLLPEKATFDELNVHYKVCGFSDWTRSAPDYGASQVRQCRRRQCHPAGQQRGDGPMTMLRFSHGKCNKSSAVLLDAAELLSPLMLNTTLYLRCTVYAYAYEYTRSNASLQRRDSAYLTS